MNRISVFVRRQRIKKLERWIMRAILVEAFFVALFPTIAAAAVLVGILAWFFRLQIDSRFRMRSLPFDVPVIIFLTLGAASVFLSSARSFELIYNYCGIVGVYILTYILIGQNVRTSEQIIKVAKALALSAFLVVMYGYSQYIFGVDISEMRWVDGEAFPELRKRIFSTLENPNVLAGYLDVMICLALGLLVKVGGKSQKIIFIAAIALLTACLAMTYSRGAFLSIAIVFVICGLLKDKKIFFLFAILTGVIIYFDSTFTQRILSIFTETTDSSEGLRVGIWVSTISMLADHPFIGIGWGAFKFIYPQYNYYLTDTSQIIYHAHNLFLQTAAEVGIVGALAYFWYFFGTMFQTFDIDTAEKYRQLKNEAVTLGKHAKPSRWKERLVEVILTSNFLQTLARSKSLLLDRMAELSDKIMDWFSFTPSESDIRKSGKSDEDFSDEELGVEKKSAEVVHHEELKWSKPPLSKDDKKSDKDDNDKMDLQKFATKRIDLFPRSLELLYTPDDEVLAGLRLGIGLAFLSMALNGMSDDLLFNIPSSILMWMLGALSAAINIEQKAED